MSRPSIRIAHIAILDKQVDPRLVVPEIGEPDTDWFKAASNGQLNSDNFIPFHPMVGEPLPQFNDFDGIIIGGSVCNLSMPTPEQALWVEPIKDLLREAYKINYPILGVCFGAQLIAQTFDAQIIRHANGTREFGSHKINITEAGKHSILFRGISEDTFLGQESHGDDIANPPEIITILATNNHAPVQALQVGETIWGTQFHPEILPPVMHALVTAGIEEVPSDQTAETLIQDTPHARLVIANFLDYIESTKLNHSN